MIGLMTSPPRHTSKIIWAFGIVTQFYPMRICADDSKITLGCLMETRNTFIFR